MTTTTTETTPAPPNWRKLHALGLPEGSIRALLAVAVCATIWVVLARHPDQEVPDYLRDLMFIILGHYFASRRRTTAQPVDGPGPLFLPKGSIRVVLFAGFAAVAVLLWRGGNIREPMKSPGVMTLMLVAGFLLGVCVAKVGDWWAERGHPVPRWVEDGRAIIAILAALALIFLVWNRFEGILIARDPQVFDKWNLRLGNYGPEHILGAVVGFYFGSRS